MHGHENLIPIGQRSSEEVRELGRKGGIASGKSRRKKRDLKQKMKLLLSLPASDDDQADLKAMGVDPEDMDNEMVLVKALFARAAGGDTKAFDRIMDVLGKSVAREDLALRKQEAKRRASAGEDTGQMRKAKELLERVDSAIDHEAD